MALTIADRVLQTGSANTTASFTLSGSVSGYQSFAVVGNGNTTYYGAQDGTNWEVGIGTYSTTGPTLTRTTVISSSNSGSAVSTFTSPVTVYVTQPSEYAVYVAGSNIVVPNSAILGTANGGTGLNTFTANGIVFASTTAVLATATGLTWNGTTFNASNISTAGYVQTSIASGYLSSYQAAITTATPGLGTYGIHFNGQTTADYAAGITWNGGTTTTNAQAGIYVQGSGSYGTKMYIATTDSYATGAKTAISIDHTGLTNFARVRPTALGNTILDIGNYNSYALPLSGGNITGQLYVKASTSYSNAALQLGYGDSSTGSFAYIQQSFQYQGGGYSHFITSRHDAAGATSGNALLFYLNVGTTAGASSAPGTGNYLSYFMNITSHNWYVSNTNYMSLSSSALSVTGAVNSTTANITPNTTGVSTGLTVVNGDITTYRSGGTTGVIFLGSSGSKYLYFDGTNYNMPGGGLTLNGATTLTSSNYSGYSSFSGTVSGTNITNNGYSSYGNTATQTLRNSYYGILLGNSVSHLNVMADSSGNGGFYRENGGQWATYWNASQGSLGIGASTTSSSYTLYVTGSSYSTGNIRSDGGTGFVLGGAGTFARGSAGTGYLNGQYSTVETSSTTGPIYCINQTSYAPTSTTLATMYGIGFTYAPNLTGVSWPFGTAGWGMYVAAGGSASIYLDAASGRVCTGSLYTTSASYSTSASIFIGQYGGATRGYLYNDTSGFGLLTYSGSWGLQVTYGTNSSTAYGAFATGGATYGGFFGSSNTLRVNGSGGGELLIASSTTASILEFQVSSGGSWHVQNSGGVFYITQTSVADRFYINGAAVTIPGSLSKGSGTFDIDHPSVPNMRLRHSFVEGPRVDLIYRGHATLTVGTVTVDMDINAMSQGGQTMTPGTFVALTRDPDIYLQNTTGWSPVKGSINGSKLTIICQDQTSTDTISWMVVAERKDQHLHDDNIEMTDDHGRLILEYKNNRTSGPTQPGEAVHVYHEPSNQKSPTV